MKQVQRDSKYIIKRILIGVGIALILANLRKCNVYAEELTPAYMNNFGLNLLEITSSPWSQTDDSVVYNFDYGNYNIKVSNDSGTYFYFLLFKDDYNNYYFVSSNSFNSVSNCENNFNFSTINFTSSSTEYKNNNSITCSTTEVPFFNVRSLSINNFDTSTIINYFVNNLSMKNFYNQTYQDNLYQKVYTFSNDSSISSNAYNVLNYLKNNTSLVYSSIPIYLDDHLIETSISGYSQLTLTGNQAVYFLPKNYNDIQIESVQTGGSSEFPLYTNYIDFNYYFKGSIKDGYFPVNNLADLTFKNILFSSPPASLYVDSYFPMYQGGDDMSGYQYYSYIIFNNYDFDTTIYYNATLFNAFIIEDIESYNETNCFIDRNNSNICVAFDFQNEVNNAWLKGFTTDDGFVGNQQNEENNLSKIFNKLKIPFNWFRSLTTYTCSSITLPIPFLNNSITLNCLSSNFHQILGDNFYNIIFIIINGLYAYRITILNIDSITDSLDPNDDKLEVIDL